MHILVVEDEPRLGRLLRRSLQANRHLVAHELGSSDGSLEDMYFYRISTSCACFDIVCDSIWVDKAPPIAQWAVGKKGADVLTYYKHSGAIIEVLVGGHWEIP